MMMNIFNLAVIKNTVTNLYNINELSKLMMTSKSIYDIFKDILEIKLLDRNTELANIFKELSEYYSWKKDKHREIAYNKISQSIEEYDEPIMNAAQALKCISGVGKSSYIMLDQYFKNNGIIEKVEELRAAFGHKRYIIEYFKSFYGIGIVDASRFYDNGYRTLNDIWNNVNINKSQRLGILWSKHINCKISRKEMTFINNYIKTIFDPLNITWCMVGSYRRGKDFSNDIDLLIERTDTINMNYILSLLSNILPANLTEKGYTKYMGILQLGPEYIGHRLDIRIIDSNSWAYGLLYFTGSKRYNKYMRNVSKKLNMKLNEYGLFSQSGADNCIEFSAKTEHDIFNYLNIPYVPPCERY